MSRIQRILWAILAYYTVALMVIICTVVWMYVWADWRVPWPIRLTVTLMTPMLMLFTGLVLAGEIAAQRRGGQPPDNEIGDDRHRH